MDVQQQDTRNGANNDSRSQLTRYGTLSSVSDSYEELLSGGVPCPTCRGKGNIPKEQEGELVALIPVRDKRLKPRRTWLYVGIAVFLCVVTAGLLFFFLSQRDVSIDSNISMLKPSNLTINQTEKYVYFDLTYAFNITNDNYFPITLTQASTSVEFNIKLLNKTVTDFSLSVPWKSTKPFNVKIGISFDKDNGLSGMAKRCADPIPFLTQYVMIFQTNVIYSSLAHTEQSSVTTYPVVDCGNHTSTFPDFFEQFNDIS